MILLFTTLLQSTVYILALLPFIVRTINNFSIYDGWQVLGDKWTLPSLLRSNRASISFPNEVFPISCYNSLQVFSVIFLSFCCIQNTMLQTLIQFPCAVCIIACIILHIQHSLSKSTFCLPRPLDRFYITSLRIYY
jgi:hypothetical protein